MKTCTRCTCDKSSEAFSRNPRRADGLNSWCRECVSEYNRAYVATRSAQAVARVARWRLDNPDARKREYERHADKIKARAKAWLLDNPAKRRLFWANYRARKLKATPAWADKQAIAAVYAACTALNRLLGRGMFHVDHVVPLSHDLVSGLHVEDNLRIVLAAENLAKSNRFWPDMA